MYSLLMGLTTYLITYFVPLLCPYQYLIVVMIYIYLTSRLCI